MLSTYLDKKHEQITNMNPKKIYVENIRSIFGLPRPVAKFLCEAAVKEGSFVKKYAVTCPNDDCEKLIKSYDSKKEIPESIVCDNCEDFERHPYEYEKKDLSIIEYYQLKSKNGENN